MTVTVYRDAGFQGPFAHIRTGFFSGRDLVGFYNRSTSGIDLDNEISSLRVGPNTIAALYGGTSLSASAGARVIVGPRDISDLGALGMDDKISAIQVLAFREYDSGNFRSGGVVMYGGYQGGGRHAVLERGDYDAVRLSSEEVKFPANTLRSLRVSANVIAILYSGPDFNEAGDAVVVVGPTMIGDMNSVGMIDRVSSIRVVYTDAPNTPVPAARIALPVAQVPPRIALPVAQAPPRPALPVAQTPPARNDATPEALLKMKAMIIILFILVAILAAVVIAQGNRAREFQPRRSMFG